MLEFEMSLKSIFEHIFYFGEQVAVLEMKVVELTF